MWVLPLLGYLGVVVGFCFLTLAIASGLYYLSEVVEEHTVAARRILYRMIYAVVGVHTLLFIFDHFPFKLTALNIFSHFIYSSNLRRFPFVKLSDPLFIASCVLVFLNHWLAFRHFSDPMAMTNRQSYSSNSYSGRNSHFYYDTSSTVEVPSFIQISSYFGICVWLVPFALFISLSASENVLPSMETETPASMGSLQGTGPDSLGAVTGRQYKTKGMAKQLVDGVRGWISETSRIMGLSHGEKHQ